MKHRGWVITCNNPTPADIDAFEHLLCVFCVGQKEHAPTTGTPHMQCFAYFQNARTMLGVKRLLTRRFNLRPMGARATPEDNRVYCTKLETRIIGVNSWAFTKGECPHQGIRVDIKTFMDYARE